MRRAVDPDTLIGSRPSVQAALALGADALRSAGVESAPVDAEWLLAGALRVSHGALSAEPRRTLEAPEAGWYVAALRRRMKREPLQHILGSQPFRHVTVRVTADAMVPRPETELLAAWALDLLPRGPRRPLAIDLGTGTGCIACAIASERPDVEVIALEAAARAVTLARENVAALGLSGRVRVEVSELFSALGATLADVIVCNPPYLPTGLIATLAPEVSQYDPRGALDGGVDGLRVIRRIVAEAPQRLLPGGALVLETAGGDQARAVVALMEKASFTGVQTRRDLAGVERFVAGRIL
ncbi:MAG: peptide chain release factor N(5)-glutamine methyltransferase [Candidatus Rokuibacteriota bacterium]|nr:MAG: peptide chain release factor N(5)-glutamine methyltransferase [Candidatus Rokubacteria bacterium]